MKTTLYKLCYLSFISLTLLYTTACKLNSQLGMESQEDESSDGSVYADENGNARSIWSPNNFPLNVSISEAFDSYERNLIIEMAENWEESISQEKNIFHFNTFSSFSTKSRNLDDYKDQTLAIYKMSRWFDDIHPSTLGLTQYFGIRMNENTDQEYIMITHADIFINAEFYSYSVDLPTPLGAYDLGTVVLHELGHFLGLPHSSRLPTVMTEELPDLDDPRRPTPNDSLALSENYQFQANIGARGMDLDLSKGTPVRGIWKFCADDLKKLHKTRKALAPRR